jgi:hypothetical protein
MAWLDADEGDGKATQADIAGLKRRAKQTDTSPDSTMPPAQAASTSTGTSVSIPNANRKVVGLMAFAVIFSVIGQELKAKQGGAKPGSTTGLSGPAKTILGGTIATALLSFLAEAGSTGEQLGVGLAAVTAVTAMLVTGAPVWDGIRNIFGASPTTPLTAPSGSTTGTGASAGPFEGQPATRISSNY